MPESATKRVRGQLDAAGIVANAVSLADEEGVASLSMRKLAGSLGCGVMSLYNHVANKDDLFALMVDSVAAEIGGPDLELEPLQAVRTAAIATRQALVRHPWAPELWQQHLPGPQRTQRMEELLVLLDQSGLSPELAHHGFHAVTNHVLGYTLQELAMAFVDDALGKAHEYLAQTPVERYPHMVAHVHQHLDGDTASSFELVLDLILDGLVRLDQSS